MDIVKEAKKLLIKEIKKYKGSTQPEIIEKKALELAEKLSADKKIVLVGINLMDIKAPEASHKGKMQNHVKMGVEMTKEFLKKFDLDKETRRKIINCVEAHHRDIPFICIEAEICANADCYRFLHPAGFLEMFPYMEKIFGFKKALDVLDQRLDEKYNKILSLDSCKKELEEYYPLLKKLIKAAKGL